MNWILITRPTYRQINFGSDIDLSRYLNIIYICTSMYPRSNEEYIYIYIASLTAMNLCRWVGGGDEMNFDQMVVSKYNYSRWISLNRFNSNIDNVCNFKVYNLLKVHMKKSHSQILLASLSETMHSAQYTSVSWSTSPSIIIQMGYNFANLDCMMLSNKL